MVGLFGLFFLLTISFDKLLTSEGFSNNDDDDEMIVRMMTKTDSCNESDVDGTRSPTLLSKPFSKLFYLYKWRYQRSTQNQPDICIGRSQSNSRKFFRSYGPLNIHLHLKN